MVIHSFIHSCKLSRCVECKFVSKFTYTTTHILIGVFVNKVIHQYICNKKIICTQTVNIIYIDVFVMRLFLLFVVCVFWYLYFLLCLWIFLFWHLYSLVYICFGIRFFFVFFIGTFWIVCVLVFGMFVVGMFRY